MTNAQNLSMGELEVIALNRLIISEFSNDEITGLFSGLLRLHFKDDMKEIIKFLDRVKLNVIR